MQKFNQKGRAAVTAILVFMFAIIGMEMLWQMASGQTNPTSVNRPQPIVNSTGPCTPGIPCKGTVTPVVVSGTIAASGAVTTGQAYSSTDKFMIVGGKLASGFNLWEPLPMVSINGLAVSSNDIASGNITSTIPGNAMLLGLSDVNTNLQAGTGRVHSGTTMAGGFFGLATGSVLYSFNPVTTNFDSVLEGRGNTGSVSVDLRGRNQTYNYAFTFAPGSSATDILEIINPSGSGITAFLTSMVIGGTATALTDTPMLLKRTSTVIAGGTPVTITGSKGNSSSAATTLICRDFTAAPTPGTLESNHVYWTQPLLAASGGTPFTWPSVAGLGNEPFTLLPGQNAVMNMGNVTITGATITGTITMIQEK